MKLTHLWATVVVSTVHLSSVMAETNSALDQACRKERADQLARYCSDCPTRDEVAASCKSLLRKGWKAKQEYYCKNSPWASKSIFERYQMVQNFVANEPESEIYPKKTFIPCIIARESHSFDPLTVNCTASDAAGFGQVISSTFKEIMKTAVNSQTRVGKSGADGLEWLMPYSCANYPDRDLDYKAVLQEFPRDYGLQIRTMRYIMELKSRRPAIRNKENPEDRWFQLALHYNGGAEKNAYAEGVSRCTKCMNSLDENGLNDPEQVLPCLEEAADKKLKLKLKRGPYCE